MRVEKAEFRRKVVLGMAAKGALGNTRLAVVQLTRPYVEMGAVSIKRCCWPLWGNERPAKFLYCDAATVAGTSWCACHLARVFRTPEQTERSPDWKPNRAGRLAGPVGLLMPMRKAG